MPELPEVETIRRDLERVILHKQIADLEIHLGRVVKTDFLRFIATLQDNHFVRIHRTGKLLQFELAHGEFLLVHLKMTGQLICRLPESANALNAGLIVGGHPMASIDELPNKYTHVEFTFEDGTKLFFNDVRTFGYVELVSAEERADIVGKFGIEPLTQNFLLEDFEKIFQKRTAPLKSILLNQQLVSGIGNIYADEICFRAKVMPDISVSKLSKQEIKRVFNATQNILEKAVLKRGTTFSDYVDAQGKKGGYLPYLKVYQRDGRLCLRCEEVKIQKIRVAGRGTHFCPNCQR